MRKTLFSIAAIFLIASCASLKEFPVSDVIPTATIKAKTKQDKNNNFNLSVSAKNLANPNRLNPPKNVYVVWINTKNNGVKNMGQLVNKNAESSSLKTLTAFEPVEVFITAENEGNISRPSGIEISRIDL